MANRKQQTAEQIKNVLGAGYFDRNQREIIDNDPIEPISMKLPIDKVQKYDRNPRQSKNPEYDTLVELLRANGQEEALTITRRPGDKEYVIKRGGNTRLEIMKMLHHEAGDARFEIIDCLFMPWVSESDCIVGHLNENTSQGRMTLIDKARGYRQFKIEYEKEHCVEALGQRKLSALLKEKGSPINPKLLGIMNYALDALEPAIPEILSRGLGKPQIEKLKRIDQTFQRLAEAHDLYDPATRPEQIKAEFHQLLSDHDGDEWDMELIHHEFDQRLGKLLIDKVPYNRLKFDIDECLKRDPWKVELISTMDEDTEHQNQQPQTPASTGSTEADNQTTNQKPPISSPVKEPPITRKPQETVPQTSPHTVAADDLSKTTHNQATQSIKAELDAQTPSQTSTRLELPATSLTAGEFDLKSMRARIYTLALQFAKMTRIHRHLVQWNAGYGYFLDLPGTKLISARDPEKTRPDYEYKVVSKYLNKDRDQVATTFGWWMLWQAQGILDLSSDTNLVPGYDLMPDSMMKEMLKITYSLDPELENRGNGSPLMLSGATKIGMHTGEFYSPIDMALAFTYIKPDHMMKYVELLEARTQLQAYVEANSINLWKAA